MTAAGFAWWRQNNSTAATELVLYGNADIRQVELAFNASERIDDVRVREGERVRKGQLLATLDRRSLSQNVDQHAAQEQVLARLSCCPRWASA